MHHSNCHPLKEEVLQLRLLFSVPQWFRKWSRKLKDIDINIFIKDLSSSQLCTNPPDDLDKLVDMYNSTLEEILDNYAPIQTKQVSVQQQTKWYNKDIALAKKARRKGARRWWFTTFKYTSKFTSQKATK